MKKEMIFKVGDLVEFGGVEGTVTGIEENTPYPLITNFLGITETFTLTGLYRSDRSFSLKLANSTINNLPKYHWYVLSFIGNREGKVDYYYATVGVEDNCVTQTNIDKVASDNYKEDSSWVILSCSYLGHMTKEEFNS